MYPNADVLAGCSRLGKVREEGASGFLERKLAAELKDGGLSSTAKDELVDDDGWSKVNDFLDDEETPKPGSLMGTKKWAAVYLASTPEQAVQLGLALPGVDTVCVIYLFYSSLFCV